MHLWGRGRGGEQFTSVDYHCALMNNMQMRPCFTAERSWMGDCIDWWRCDHQCYYEIHYRGCIILFIPLSPLQHHNNQRSVIYQ